MGILSNSKKAKEHEHDNPVFEITCVICGEKYETSKNCENGMCALCQMENARRGYLYMRRRFSSSFPGYTKDEIDAICEKRDKLISESRDTEGLTIEELQEAGRLGRLYPNSKQFAKKIKENLVPRDPGGFYTKRYVMPVAYSGIAVDLNDVFAIVIDTQKTKDKPKHKDIVSINFFTNDPEAPMFAVGKSFQKKLFVLKNSGKRKALAKELTALCPNLTYPIMTYNEFARTIKKDGSVKGNIPADNIAFEIKYNCREGNEPFCITGTFDSINGLSFLNKFGYVYSDQIAEYLFCDRRSQKFWCKKLGWSALDLQRLAITSTNIGGIFYRLVRLFMSFS